MPVARTASIRAVVAAAFGVALVASPARAQVAAGEITGLIKDQAGKAIPGATVTVTNVGTNIPRVAVTTADGAYTGGGPRPGESRSEVELPGLEPVRRSGIRLATGEKARLDFDLALGDVREEVTVVGDLPIVEAETASLGTVV